MDDKLIRFFNKINYNNIDEFKNSKVTKVTINKVDVTWTVYIKNEKPLNIESALNLINICKKGIEDVNSIDIVFENDTVNNDDIKDYFKYLLNEVVKVSPALSSIVNNEIKTI